MDVLMRFSTEEASLILQLIEFAEAKDLLGSESNDENERGTYEKRYQLACRLRDTLASVDDSDVREVTALETVNVGGQITVENGRPWWDVSEVKLGLKRVQLLERVKELCGELAGLIIYSDSLEARQSMLEAVYMLRSAERSLKARANSDVGKDQRMKGGLWGDVCR